MPSTTSGTTNFFLDVDELIIQAFKPLGGEHISGEEANESRQTLNLILIELQNKGIPINKLDFVSQALTEDQTEYNLDPTIVDILELNLLRDGTETPLTRYSLREFHQIPIKSTKTRPSVWTVERNNNDVQLKLYPTPDNSTDTVEMMVYKKLEDITASFQKVDLSYRYLPLLTRWLSYELSLHRQGIPPDIRQELKANYKESLTDTFDEDRERADFIVTPGGVNGW